MCSRVTASEIALFDGKDRLSVKARRAGQFITLHAPPVGLVENLKQIRPNLENFVVNSKRTDDPA